jgi:hypothetical protein
MIDAGNMGQIDLGSCYGLQTKVVSSTVMQPYRRIDRTSSPKEHYDFWMVCKDTLNSGLVRS